MKSYNVKLDFYLGVLDVSPIEFGQLNSNSCQLDFELTTDRNVVNLADKFLKLVIRTPKGQIIEDGVAVSNATGGLATIVLANDSISEVGVHICEMRMYGKTNMTLQSTKYFRYTVTPLLGEDNVEIDTRYSTVHELMWEVQRMKDDIINDAMNYESSINKPRINGVELTGNKGLQELGIQPTGDYATNGVVDTEISQHNLSGLSHPDIRNAIPKNVSQLVNDSGYLTELPVHNHNTIYYTKEQMNSSLGLKVDKELGKGLSENDFTNLYKNKLDGVEDNANNYTHPINHNASMIVEDDLHNFVTVTEKQSWTNKAEVGAIPTKLSQLANDNNTVRDANYVHTDNNYTTTEKNKLSGISASATKTEKSTTNGNVKIDGVETVVYTHPSGTNPHGTTKGDVGLGSVDNTSDASKPISTATQNALNNKVDKVVGKQLSTEDYTTAEKSKLGGVAANANNYVHPSTHPASIIVQDASNRLVSDTEKTTWNNKANTTVATTTVNGLMAKEDKTKLDSIVLGTSGNINQDITNHNANAEAHPSIIASVDKKIVLNGEVGKSNFDFIENKVVQDGLVGSAMGLVGYSNIQCQNMDVLNSTIIIDAEYDKFSFLLDAGLFKVQRKIEWDAFQLSTNPTRTLTKTVPNKRCFIVIDLLDGNFKISQTINGVTETKSCTLNTSGTIDRIGMFYDSIVKNGNVLLYNRQLTQQEIQHNFSVLNNSPSVNQLQVTDSANKSSILSFGADGNHVEMNTGRTLEEEYMGVLEGMSQEYTSIGTPITVNDGLNARLVGAEITGNTVNNLLSKKSLFGKIEANVGASRVVINQLEPNGVYTILYDVKENKLTADNAVVVITNGESYGFNVEPIQITKTTTVGLKRARVSCKSGDISTLGLRPYAAGITDGQYVVLGDNIVLLRGDHTTTPIEQLPFNIECGLNSTQVILSNNGTRYPLYASLEDKAAKKPILLGGVSGVSDKLTMNSDGSLTEVDSTKQVVFNGSENWLDAGIQGLTNTICFQLNSTDHSNNSPAICDFFKWEHTMNDVEHIYCMLQSVKRIFINKSKLSTQDVAGFKAWLAQNPITVRYQLATPVTTTIPKEVNSPVLTSQSNSIIVDSQVAPSSFSVKIPTTSQIKRQYTQTLLNGYTGTVSANLLKDGRVQIDMTVTIPSTFNQTVFSLPVELRPKVGRKLIGFNGNNPVTILINTDGTVRIPTSITGVVELNGMYNL